MQDVNDLIYKPVKSKNDVNKLLQVHKNLVYWCLGKMNKLNDQECESAAWEALWDAINRFDVFYGFEDCFSTESELMNIISEYRTSPKSNDDVAKMLKYAIGYGIDDYDSLINGKV